MKRDVAELVVEAALVSAQVPQWVQERSIGQCFDWAANEMINLSILGKKRLDGITLVHASIITPPLSYRHGHGWLEEKGKVRDWQTIEYYGKPPIPKAKFYKERQPKKIRRYTWEEARKMLIKHEHYGPWHNI